MTWTPPKTWTFGEVLTAADLNTYNRDNIDHLPRMLAASAVAFGNNPPDVGSLDMQAGSAVITFTGGVGTLVWPTPWPQGLLMVLLGNGDGGVGGNVMFEAFVYGLVSMQVRAVDTVAGVLASGTLRVNWLAIGW